MLEGVILDNDVVLKVCAYRLHMETISALTVGQTSPAILTIARFTLRSRLAKSSGLVDNSGAAHALEEFLSRTRHLVPTTEEIRFAADLEERATVCGYQFDTGESQLVAILICRQGKLLVTGDKRAIIAIAGISLVETEGRLACLEQLIASLFSKLPPGRMRGQVCTEPNVDRAITACFACTAPYTSDADILAGLASYSRHLRDNTANILVSKDALL